MSEFVKVIPVNGAKVFDPEVPRAEVPKEGMRVRLDLYWKRMKDQGVVRFEADGEGEVDAI